MSLNKKPSKKLTDSVRMKSQYFNNLNKKNKKRSKNNNISLDINFKKKEFDQKVQISI